MGEVYQAEDLKLDQTVALKFLPQAVALSSSSIARFHAEARLARQVSHPNVCRVYDIGEASGLHFLTMEFIDGEDLSSLLRQIGRLPGESAVEIARQICAGLGAAHEAGVLHRDLKPSNVMIDRRGRARITDFGIATVTDGAAPSVLGTPSYMAPEQLAGHEGTVRSDIYALGLVLYELFTGRRAVDAVGLADAVLYHASRQTPQTPSTWVPELDPRVERTIQRCLETDPLDRPDSAIAVAAALPGGNALDAALAAGKTPSPEMVAAAGGSEGLRPAVALALCAVVLTGSLAMAWSRDRVSAMGDLAASPPPDVLMYKAREVLQRFGYEDLRGDRAAGFTYDDPEPRHAGDDAGRRPSQTRRSPATFWYRESPHPFVVGTFEPGFVGSVTVDNPPPGGRGSRRVSLDLRGRLVGFEAMPTPFETARPSRSEVDWAPLFATVGADVTRFTAVKPEWTAPVASDTRAAWTGVFEDDPDRTVRIEAAAYQGRVVAFEMFGRSDPAPTRGSSDDEGPVWLELVFVLFMAAGYGLAWRNVKASRGDRRGAFRIVGFIFTTRMIEWGLSAHHVAGSGEFSLFWRAVGVSMFVAANVGAFYLALEPAVRRRQPRALIGWTRVLEGRWRDPLVARQVCGGIAGGVAVALVAVALTWPATPAPGRVSLDAALSLRRVAGFLLGTFGESIALGLGFSTLVVLLCGRVRPQWLGAVIATALFAGLDTEGFGASSAVGLVAGTVMGAALVLFLMRSGLVAVVAATFAARVLLRAPLTLDVNEWFAGVSLVAMTVLMAVAVFASLVALERRPAPLACA